MTYEEAYAEILVHLTGVFDIPADEIRPDSVLRDDLDLDSIDAVDLMVKLQEATGRKVTPDQFEHVKTVKDLAQLVQMLHDRK